MDFDDNEEDCTIYIEELKSDDPNLKINAVQKVQKIAEILGASRVRDEMIPYIIEIIEELDNEDEFLIKLSDQITGLVNLIGGKQHTQILIQPLEILASIEENSVREKSVESLTQISKDQLPNFYVEHFLPMITQMSGWDNYPSRISACQLIGNCYERFQNPQQKELIEIFKNLCKDDTPMVRRTAAEIIESLCQKINSQEIIVQHLISAWKILINDSIDSVKVKAIESSICIIRKISKKDSSNLIIPPLIQIIKNKQNQIWRIRYAISEISAQLIPFLDKNVIEKDILYLYEELLKDAEHEVKSITLQQLPILCKQLPKQLLASTILPTFNKLVQDASQHVRSSLAEVLCIIASNFEKENVISGIIPIIEMLLKDEIIEVRLMTLKNIYQLNQVIGPDNIKKHVIPFFQAIQNEKQWRYRHSFCEMLPKFKQQLGFEDFKNLFQDIILTFAQDHYSHIRDQNFKNLFEMSLEIGFAKIKPLYQIVHDDMIQSKNYIFRVSLLQGLLTMHEVMTASEVTSYFRQSMEKLLNDKVPNVVINLLKVFIALKDKLEQRSVQEFLQQIQSKCSDQDDDVSYYAQLATGQLNN